MRITVNLIEQRSKRFAIRFSCQSGLGVGIWESEVPPQIDRSYEIEFDVEIVITNRNAIASDRKQVPFLDTLDDWRMHITALIEDQDEDGMAYLRLSDDCLTMVEAESPNMKGLCVHIQPDVEKVKLTVVGW